MSMELEAPLDEDEDEDEEADEALAWDAEPDFWSRTIWVHQAGGATKVAQPSHAPLQAAHAAETDEEDELELDELPPLVETVKSLAGKLKLVFHLILSLFALTRWSSIAALSLASKALVLTAADARRSRSAISKATSDCESLVYSNILLSALDLAEALIEPI